MASTDNIVAEKKDVSKKIVEAFSMGESTFPIKALFPNEMNAVVGVWDTGKMIDRKMGRNGLGESGHALDFNSIPVLSWDSNSDTEHVVLILHAGSYLSAGENDATILYAAGNIKGPKLSPRIERKEFVNFVGPIPYCNDASINMVLVYEQNDALLNELMKLGDKKRKINIADVIESTNAVGVAANVYYALWGECVDEIHEALGIIPPEDWMSEFQKKKYIKEEEVQPKKQMNVSPLQVWVRFRPLVNHEVTENHEEIKRKATGKKGKLTIKTAGGFKMQGRRKRPVEYKGKGYTGLADADVNNQQLYDIAVKQNIPFVLEGGTGCCFCYGHTGSGKTHTQLGYGEDKGLYYLAADEILTYFQNSDNLDDMRLEVKFGEMHNGIFYDLLNGRTECTLREDGSGKVHIRSKNGVISKAADWSLSTGAADYSIRSACCSTAEELAQVVANGCALRQVGNSLEHDQSSRSHAVMQMEVTTDEIQYCRNTVARTDVMATPIIATAEKTKTAEMVKKYIPKEDGSFQILSDEEAGVDSELIECWEAERAVWLWLQKQEAKRLEKIESEAKQRCAGVGGELVFVDLAGSEYGEKAQSMRERTAEEIEEAKFINQSLSNLNAVIQAKRKKKSRIPFRDSPLTMVLKEFLTSEDVFTIMIANASPSKEHAPKTQRTLQYAGLLAKK